MPDSKPPGAVRPAGALVRGAELGAWASASGALRDARAGAESILASAHAARDAERRRGYAEGYGEGAERAAALIARATADAAARLDRIEAALPELVADTIARILGSFDVRDLVVPAVSQAMGQLRRGASATVRASPSCVEPLHTLLAETGGEAIRLEPDPGLADGRCVLSSELGDVELGIEAQLRALRQGLLAGWAGRNEP